MQHVVFPKKAGFSRLIPAAASSRVIRQLQATAIFKMKDAIPASLRSAKQSDHLTKYYVHLWCLHQISCDDPFTRTRLENKGEKHVSQPIREAGEPARLAWQSPILRAGLRARIPDPLLCGVGGRPCSLPLRVLCS